MKKLTFLIFIVFNSLPVFAPMQQYKRSDTGMKVTGQVVNKLGETSKSTQRVTAEHQHSGTVVGKDVTDTESNFTINSIITAIGDINGFQNYAKMLQSNPFTQNTSFEVVTTENFIK